MTTSEALIEETGFVDIPLDPELDLKEDIRQLKEEKNAVILAHFYQVPEIQDIADFVGDSLELTSYIGKTNAELIVFGGVYFMAETAKILHPGRRILLPDKSAGCSLADSCPADKFEEFVRAHPDHLVVSYINCSAGVKALSDIVCTSSSALKIINSIPEDQSILFAPDINLGKYLIQQTGRDMVLWNGKCEVHEAFSMDKILELYHQYPNAEIIAHPESEPNILRASAFVGSTSQLIRHVVESKNNEFIVATEAGVLHEIKKRVPEKTVIPAPVFNEKNCNCGECAYMKLNTLEKLYRCLRYEQPEVHVDEKLRLKAIRSINRMYEILGR